MRLMTAASAALVLCSVPGGCVSAPMGGGPDADMQAMTSQRQAQGDSFNASMMMAQAQANRPGDEALTCDQLQAEMIVMFNDPKFQATVATMGAQAQGQLDKANAASAAAAGAGFAGGIAGAAAGMIPGAGWLSGGFAAAQAANAKAQMAESTRNQANMLANTTEIMPQIMRGQRINDLAMAKNCAFIKQGRPPA